jgi:hypothetical protein
MTAEDYALENMQGADLKEIEVALIGFAEMKCKELLEIVAKKAKIVENRSMVNGYDYTERLIDKDSILNAVDLKQFIK